jgi:RNA polymerase sigma-70 factor (ECF subfamily)
VLEDKLLIWKLKRGDRDALCRIYDKYRDDLLRISAGLLDVTGDAEDVVHDVFIVFVRSLPEFDLTGSLKGYLATCVANRARNVNRTKRRRPTVGLDEVESFVSRCKRPDEWIVANEDFRRLKEAMNLLGYEQKEAVILRIQGAMKFREIAELQETTTRTVISRYRYGLNKLRSILDDEVTE